MILRERWKESTWKTSVIRIWKINYSQILILVAIVVTVIRRESKLTTVRSEWAHYQMKSLRYRPKWMTSNNSMNNHSRCLLRERKEVQPNWLQIKLRLCLWILLGRILGRDLLRELILLKILLLISKANTVEANLSKVLV